MLLLYLFLAVSINLWCTEIFSSQADIPT